MRVAREGVGGGAPGTRVCAYAQLRTYAPATRAVRSRASCARLVRAPGDACVVRPSLAEKINRPATPGHRDASPCPSTGRPDRHPSPPCCRVATPRRDALGARPTTPQARMRKGWVRGGDAPGKKIFEKILLTTTRTPSKVSASSPTQPNKTQQTPTWKPPPPTAPPPSPPGSPPPT